MKKEEYFKIPNFRERCQKILDHYGLQKQLTQTSEELSELNVVITKKANLTIGEPSPFLGMLMDELADVYIMLNQMKIAFGINENEMGKKIDEKLSRQIIRIDSEVNLDELNLNQEIIRELINFKNDEKHSQYLTSSKLGYDGNMGVKEFLTYFVENTNFTFESTYGDDYEEGYTIKYGDITIDNDSHCSCNGFEVEEKNLTGMEYINRLLEERGYNDAINNDNTN